MLLYIGFYERQTRRSVMRRRVVADGRTHVCWFPSCREAEDTRGMQRGVEEYGVGSRGRRGWRR